MTKAIKQYLKAIERRLSCDRQTKKAYLAALQSRIAETEAAEEAYSYEALCARFGAPDALADRLMETLSPAQLKRAMSQKRTALLAAGIALLAALLVWGILMLSLYLEGRKNVNGFTVDVLSGSELLIPEDTAHE